MTPFEALYGNKPPQLALCPYQQTNIAAVEELLQERRRIDQLVTENLAQAGVWTKQYADRHGSERVLGIGFTSSFTFMLNKL